MKTKKRLSVREVRDNAGKAIEAAASQGYAAGFTTGGRYALQLMLGIPRPSRVILDDEMELGEVAVIANPATDLQRYRIEKLGEFLDAVHETDLRTVASRNQEIAPDLRLEQIVKACNEADVFSEELYGPDGRSAFVDRVRALARGER